jgi:lipopolysaccharide/colanic/teichoic acid biosynthesis glycosyltransferase
MNFSTPREATSELRTPSLLYFPAQPRLRSSFLPLWKRSLDVACILFGLPALLLLMPLIALAIRMCSRGPILFRQERIGLLGEPFVCLKFRTMQVEADTGSHQAHMEKVIGSAGPMTKLDVSNDARVIPVGGLLRATGLDELPQLINVLKGEMSLIGPRPCVRYEYEKFSPQDRLRFNAVPGLTGLWQVSGKNGTSFQQMINLDVQYAQNLSLAGDLKILWRTLPVLVEQARAHRQRRATAVPAGSHSPAADDIRFRTNQTTDVAQGGQRSPSVFG